MVASAVFVCYYSLGPIGTNMVILGCLSSQKVAIIDAPEGGLETAQIVLKEKGLTPEFLLLTHSHWDHIGDAAKIKKAFNIPVYVHKEDCYNVVKPGADGLGHEQIEAIKEASLLTDRIQLGNLQIEVLHTPGHSHGSVCFYLPTHSLLLSGDTLFQGGMGRVDLTTSDPAKMKDSLALLAKMPGETRFIPGHGEESTIAAEHWLKKYK